MGCAKYGKVWIDIEYNPSKNCSWNDHTPASNCNYIKEIADAIKEEGREAGVYSTRK